MSKFIKVFLFAAFLVAGLNSQAQFQDSLIRSAGFYFSPGVTNFNEVNAPVATDPRFAISTGLRFKNELKKGFYIESGIGVTLFGAVMPTTYDTIYDYYTGTVTNVFGEQNKYEQIHISTPFLAGYRTTKGKVRFETAAGFAFNLRIMQLRSKHEFVVNTAHDDSRLQLRPNFGTSFSAIVKAGISIPIGERATVDILPTFRYAMLYFEPEDKDIGQCIKTDEQKWSAGIDIGFTWKLEDKTPQGEWRDTKTKVQEIAYTNQYQDQPAESTEKPVRKKATGPKNFMYIELGGNAMSLSHNYERTLVRKDIVSIQARAGFGYVPDFISIPLGVNVTLGRYKKKFEMGIGTTLETITTQDIGYYHFDAHLVPSIAYRYEASSHFFLRLALMSHYFFDTNEVLPGIGVSLGGCF